MISNFTSGTDPGGLARYLLGYKDQKTDKKAVVLGSAGVRTDTLAHLITDFELGGLLHPELGKAVLHISLSFNPDDAARMSDHTMRQVAEDYLQKMGMKETQYLLVRHQDRPHEHLHIMVNRVANDGHTVGDSNNYLASRGVLAELVAKHDLTPADKNRPHLQNPGRLRGKDLDRYKLRKEIDQQLVTDKQTQRPALLAALETKGISHREFRDKDGNVTGISFQKGGYACKGSALGPDYSSAGIDRRLVANQQNALEANKGQEQAAVAPDPVPTAAREDAAQLLVPPVVPVPVGEDVQPLVGAPPQPLAVPAEGKQSEVSGPVEVPIIPLAEMTVTAGNAPDLEPSAPAPVEPASSILPSSSLPVAASKGKEPGAELAPPVEQPTEQGAEARVPDAREGSRTDEVAVVGTRTGGGPAVGEEPETPAQPRYSTPAEQKEFDRKLAAWEEQLAEEARYEEYAVRYNDLLVETTRKIAAADQEPYQSMPAFEALLHTHGLALLPAAGEEPVRVVHRSSGEEFPAEDILLAGRPFLDTVQAKVAQAAAVAAPPVIDWEPRYEQYEQARAVVLAQNKAIIQVSWLLEDNPHAAGVKAAIALVQAPGTPPLGNGSLLLNLQSELTRQQDREDEIRWVAQRQVQLEETAKGRFGFMYTKAAVEARDELRYLEAPPKLPLNVGERRFLQPEPPALTLEQFAQHQQPGLDQVRAAVKAALATDFTQWHEFKSQVESPRIETTLSAEGKVSFRHKASGQTYRSDEVMTNLVELYGEAKARGEAQQAKQPQKSAPVQNYDQERSM